MHRRLGHRTLLEAAQLDSLGKDAAEELRALNNAIRTPGVADVQRGWLIILAFLVQLITILIVTDPSALAIKKAVLAITALMLLLGILPNLRWWAFRVFAVGFVLNTLVMSVNGGLMPVTLENHQRVLKAEVQIPSLGQTPPHSKNVLLASSDTKLRFLSDTVYIPVPKPKVYSIGDLFLAAGVIVFVSELAWKGLRWRRRSKLAATSMASAGSN